MPNDEERRERGQRRNGGVRPRERVPVVVHLDAERAEQGTAERVSGLSSGVTARFH